VKEWKRKLAIYNEGMKAVGKDARVKAWKQKLAIYNEGMKA
jgi:hypothetical protein